MKPVFTLSLFLLAFCSALFSQSDVYFPPLEGDTWETLDPTELGWCADSVQNLIDFVGEKNSKAFIILKDGKIVVEEYYGSYTQDSLWYWASAGKSLMGVLIGLAQEDGFLNIEDPSSDYLGEGWTECNAEEEALVKVRHQISMATGFDDSVEPPGSTNNCFDPACFQCLATPETRWAYHNSAYRVVQDVLENATGTGKNWYTWTRLGNRIGMGGFWFNYIYYSKARDMARFGLMVLARGDWDGDPVMSDMNYYEQMVNSSQNVNPSYGYLWWLNGKESFMLSGLQFQFPGALVPEAPEDMFAALGKDDQKIYVVPSMGLVVVRQGNSAGPIAQSSSSFDRQVWDRIMRLVCMATASREIIPEIMINVYPNPAKEQMFIEGPDAFDLVRLLDANGRVVFQKMGHSPGSGISIEGLPAGVYTLKVELKGKVIHQKVVLTD